MLLASFLPYAKLTIGDSWNWIISLANYPSSDGWVISIILKGVDKAPIVLVSVPYIDGIGHIMASSSTNTSSYLPGIYKAQVFITSSESERQTVGLTTIELLPDLSTVSADFDPRSFNQIALDAINDTLSGTCSRDYLETIFKDSTFKYKTTNELIRLKNYYQQEVNRDNGLKDGRML